MHDRMPQVGDLLFVTCRDSDYHSTCICHTHGEKHIGHISEIHRDTWGHQNRVLVEWSTHKPINYRDEYGYHGSNIHNLRREFTIIRDGQEVP